MKKIILLFLTLFLFSCQEDKISNNELQKLNSRISSLEAEISSLEAENINNKNTISDLEWRVDDNEEKTSNLETNLEKIINTLNNF